MKAKVCLIGPKGVGKTSIASKIDNATVSSQLDARTTYASMEILVGRTHVNLQISDISGEEKLRSMGPIYYKGAEAALCIFDLTTEKTLQALRPWIKSVKNYATAECILIIIGNKYDMENRQVCQFRAQKYAESFGAQYFEVSAYTGKGLLNVMIYIAKRLILSNDCYNTYAAKRNLTSNFVEYTAAPEKVLKRRFSCPLRTLSLKHVNGKEKQA